MTGALSPTRAIHTRQVERWGQIGRLPVVKVETSDKLEYWFISH